MPTIFEMLTNRAKLLFSKPQVTEKTVWNPVGCHIGSLVTIDAVDHYQKRYRVDLIQENTINFSGTKVVSVEYYLREILPMRDEPHMAIDNSEYVRLALLPTSDGEWQAWAMRLDYDAPYEQPLHDSVNSGDTQFNMDDESFWRIGDRKSSLSLTVKAVADTDGNGVAEVEEVTTKEVERWDYSRRTEFDGTSVEEFLDVDMNKETGWMQIWRGLEVHPSCITVL